MTDTLDEIREDLEAGDTSPVPSDKVAHLVHRIDSLRAENERLKAQLAIAREGLEKLASHPACHRYTGRLHEFPTPFPSAHSAGYALGVEDGHRYCANLSTDALQRMKEVGDD